MIHITRENFDTFKFDVEKLQLICIHGGPGLDCSYLKNHLQEIDQCIEPIFYTQGDLIEEPNFEFSELTRELDMIVTRIAGNGGRFGFFAHSFGGLLLLKYLQAYKIKAPIVLCNWIYDMKWLDLFSEQINIESETIIEFPEVKNEKENLRNRMLSYLNFYFPKDSRGVGRTLLKEVDYRPNWLSIMNEDKFNNFSGLEILERIDFPILSILGTQDKVVVPGYFESLQSVSCLQQSQIEGGHFCFLDQPEKFKLVVSEYIKLNHRRF